MIQHSAIDRFSAEPAATEALAADGLLADAQAGSVEALAHLCEAARTAMIDSARRGLPPALQAKLGASDIVQDAVVDAHRCFPQFAGRSPAEFFGWLRTILRRRVADSVRRYQVADRRSVNREVRLAECEHSYPCEIMPRVHAGPEASVIRREDAAALEQAIAGLTDDGQAVLRLRHWEGKGFDEIALEIGKSEAAVRKIWYRSLQRLGEIVRSDAALAADGDAGA